METKVRVPIIPKLHKNCQTHEIFWAGGRGGMRYVADANSSGQAEIFFSQSCLY